VVRYSLNHLAFTLIELLFAIVIMGITMVSVPVIISSNAKGFDATIIQEAIFAASAELNQILAFRWDENSIDDNATNILTLSRVIDTAIGGCDPTTRLRPGHILEPLHRRCLDSNTTTPTPLLSFGLDANDTVADDIDDIDITKKDMFIGDPTSIEGYKHAYQSEFSISYAEIGTVTAANKNAKLIEIIVRDDEDNIVTTLKSYTLNIGEIDFYKRTY